MQIVTYRKALCSQQVQQSDGARKLCARVDRPGIQNYRHVLSGGQELNCLHTTKDNEIDFGMCGENVSTTRGRNLQSTQRQVPKLSTQNAPLELNALVLRHSFLRFDTVCAQVMAHYQNQAYRQGELFSS